MVFDFDSTNAAHRLDEHALARGGEPAMWLSRIPSLKTGARGESLLRFLANPLCWLAGFRKPSGKLQRVVKTKKTELPVHGLVPAAASNRWPAA